MVRDAERVQALSQGLWGPSVSLRGDRPLRIFVLWLPTNRDYPTLGLYTTLEKAVAAAYGDGDPPSDLCIYEEETDQIYDDPKHPPFEPIRHDIPRNP